MNSCILAFIEHADLSCNVSSFSQLVCYDWLRGTEECIEGVGIVLLDVTAKERHTLSSSLVQYPL